MSNRRCFITAPYGLDLSALQRALEEHGVDWQWAEDLPTGVPLMEAASKAIQRADFLLAISSESTLKLRNQYLNRVIGCDVAEFIFKSIFSIVGTPD